MAALFAPDRGPGLRADALVLWAERTGRVAGHGGLRLPGPAEHEVVQDVHGVLALLAAGVDVAAGIEAVLGDVVAGQAARRSSAVSSAGGRRAR
jgi:hypothetical protein